MDVHHHPDATAASYSKAKYESNCEGCLNLYSSFFFGMHLFCIGKRWSDNSPELALSPTASHLPILTDAILAEPSI